MRPSLAALRAAHQAIRPGVKASDVDHAARDVIAAHGFGKDFKHPSDTAWVLPQLFTTPSHVCIRRRLVEVGMVFNVEPDIYVESYGGVRQCDLVAVTEDGAENLTAFQTDWQELTLP